MDTKLGKSLVWHMLTLARMKYKLSLLKGGKKNGRKTH